MAEEIRIIGAQNTGNPVLDSLVNLMAGKACGVEELETRHASLLKLAALEPGGLHRSDACRQAAEAVDSESRGFSGHSV